jgi:hypothetical protein
VVEHARGPELTLSIFPGGQSWEGINQHVSAPWGLVKAAYEAVEDTRAPYEVARKGRCGGLKGSARYWVQPLSAEVGVNNHTEPPGRPHSSAVGCVHRRLQ